MYFELIRQIEEIRRQNKGCVATLEKLRKGAKYGNRLFDNLHTTHGPLILIRRYNLLL